LSKNKVTANYLILISQTESDIPKVYKASRDRIQELNKVELLEFMPPQPFLGKSIPNSRRVKKWPKSRKCPE
jgi:hypothetical protein